MVGATQAYIHPSERLGIEYHEQEPAGRKRRSERAGHIEDGELSLHPHQIDGILAAIHDLVPAGSVFHSFPPPGCDGCDGDRARITVPGGEIRRYLRQRRIAAAGIGSPAVGMSIGSPVLSPVAQAVPLRSAEPLARLTLHCGHDPMVVGRSDSPACLRSTGAGELWG